MGGDLDPQVPGAGGPNPLFLGGLFGGILASVWGGAWYLSSGKKSYTDDYPFHHQGITTVQEKPIHPVYLPESEFVLTEPKLYSHVFESFEPDFKSDGPKHIGMDRPIPGLDFDDFGQAKQKQVKLRFRNLPKGSYPRRVARIGKGNLFRGLKELI